MKYTTTSSNYQNQRRKKTIPSSTYKAEETAESSAEQAATHGIP